MNKLDVIIIGAGAAGLMCAIESGRRGRSVLLIDKSPKIGEKIRISGGGRCNFTNIYASADNYLSQNPHFCKSALKRYTQYDFIELVDSYGIKHHEKTLGQLFCDKSSKQIIDMLIAECEKVSVEFALETNISTIEKQGNVFCVKSDSGEFESESLVIATGGPSIPKMGSTGFGYEIAKQFGLNIIPPRAGLVPLTFEGEMLEWMKSLAGTSVNCSVKCNGVSFEEAMLFTHRGLSGPAILQISSYWREGDKITINMCPEIDIFDYLKSCKEESPKSEIAPALSKYIPKKLAKKIVEDLTDKVKFAETSDKILQEIANYINDWQIIPSGTEGYRTAEVTLGGVDTDELSSKNFESKKVAKLYFIGEVVDVTGHLGGFNFQWAWSSAHACGQFC